MSKQELAESERQKIVEEYMRKPLHEITDREWRIFREDNDIMTKGGKIPNPIRGWDEIQLDHSLRDNISQCGYSKPMPI